MRVGSDSGFEWEKVRNLTYKNTYLLLTSCQRAHIINMLTRCQQIYRSNSGDKIHDKGNA